MRKLVLLSVMLLGLSVPGHAQDTATVQRLADQFVEAFNKNSAAGVSEMYTEEAFLIPPEADVRMGRRDIQAFWTQQAREAENLTVTVLDVKPLGSEAARAVVRSEATARGPQARHVTARNLIVLQKVGADWKVSSHIWNNSAPARYPDDAPRGYSRLDRSDSGTQDDDDDDRYQRRSERDGWRSGRSDPYWDRRSDWRDRRYDRRYRDRD